MHEIHQRNLKREIILESLELKEEEKNDKLDLLKGELDLLTDDFLNVSIKIKKDIRKLSQLEEEGDFMKQTISAEREKILLNVINDFNTFFYNAQKKMKGIKKDGWAFDIYSTAYNHFNTETSKIVKDAASLFKSLPHINEVIYINNSKEKIFLEPKVEDVEGGIHYHPTQNQWQIDKHVLHEFYKEFEGSSEDLNLCLAMYLIHEAFHKDMHSLDRYTVNGIGDYARVIEEADYQADVYAMINVLLLQIAEKGESMSVGSECISLIKIALRTTTSFAKLEQQPPYNKAQIRRVNRTLIWICQWIFTEKIMTNFKKSEEHYTEILKVLFKKPVIDIEGFEIFTNKKRIFFMLDSERASSIRICTFLENKITRNELNTSVQLNFVEGLQNLDLSKLHKAMLSYLTSVRLI